MSVIMRASILKPELNLFWKIKINYLKRKLHHWPLDMKHQSMTSLERLTTMKTQKRPQN